MDIIWIFSYLLYCMAIFSIRLFLFYLSFTLLLKVSLYTAVFLYYMFLALNLQFKVHIQVGMVDLTRTNYSICQHKKFICILRQIDFLVHITNISLFLYISIYPKIAFKLNILLLQFSVQHPLLRKWVIYTPLHRTKKYKFVR